MGLFVGPLSGVVARDCAIVVEANPLCLLIEPIADRDVEVGNLAIVEDVAGGGCVEGVLVVEDLLLQVMDLVFVPLCCDGGGGFPIGDGLQESIGDAPE
jgi:hypothetical protein